MIVIGVSQHKSPVIVEQRLARILAPIGVEGPAVVAASSRNDLNCRASDTLSHVQGRAVDLPLTRRSGELCYHAGKRPPLGQQTEVTLCRDIPDGIFSKRV